jgi:hypothetical protein
MGLSAVKWAHECSEILLHILGVRLPTYTAWGARYTYAQPVGVWQSPCTIQHFLQVLTVLRPQALNFYLNRFPISAVIANGPSWCLCPHTFIVLSVRTCRTWAKLVLTCARSLMERWAPVETGEALRMFGRDDCCLLGLTAASAMICMTAASGVPCAYHRLIRHPTPCARSRGNLPPALTCSPLLRARVVTKPPCSRMPLLRAPCISTCRRSSRRSYTRPHYLLPTVASVLLRAPCAAPSSRHFALMRHNIIVACQAALYALSRNIPGTRSAFSAL